MYSVVLAAMLTTTGVTPAWGGGGWYNYTGCYGCYGCGGCRGGCCGGCFGCGGCYGCWGSCYGCYGCYGCSGCYGCYGCYGCSGCCGGYGAVVIQPVVVRQAPTPPPPAAEPLPTPKKDASTAAAAPARVIVQLPAQAELYIDGQRSVSTTTTRTVITPRLPAGDSFYYQLRAEVLQDGKPVQKDQRVLLRAGQVAHVDFRDMVPAPAVADNGSRRTVSQLR